MADESKISPTPNADSESPNDAKAATAAGSRAVPTRPRRRWLQYSLRSLFVLTAICAVASWRGASWYHEIVDEEEVIAELKKAGASVTRARYFERGAATPCDEVGPPLWFRDLVGKHDFNRAIYVYFGDQYVRLPIPPEQQRPDENGTVKTFRSVLSEPTELEMRLIEKLRGLRKLQLLGDKIDDESLIHLRELPVLNQLQLSAAIVREGRGLRHLSGVRELRDLRIYLCKLSPDGFRNIASIKTLERLELRSSCVNDESLESIANLTNLRVLDLDHTQVTDEGLLKLSTLKNLDSLVLSDTKTKGTALGVFSNAPLVFLNLDRTSVGDAEIHEILKLQNLETLCLGATNVTANGAAQFSRLSRLKSLTLPGRLFSDEDRRMIRSKLPTVSVDFSG